MPFTLTIASGPDSGTAFAFDAQQARMGRTADNDIVVKDGSASRSHCKVYEEGQRYFLEDLKSANGTKINGNVIEGKNELHNGDTITIGDLSFTFTLPDATVMQPAYDGPPPRDVNATMIGVPSDMLPPPDEAPAAEPPELDPNATFLKSPEELEAIKASLKLKLDGARPEPAKPPRPGTKPPKAKEVEQAPPKVDANATMLKSPEELEALREGWKKSGLDADTGPMAAPKDEDLGDATVPPPRGKAAKKVADTTIPDPTAEQQADVEAARALVRRGEAEELQPSGGVATKEIVGLPGRAPLRPRRGSSARGADDEPSEMTAAEKARMKRELSGSATGKLKLFWTGLSKRGRIAAGAGGGLFAAAAIGVIAWSLVPAADPTTKALPPEPSVLSPNTMWVEQSFGLGEGVDYPRPDLKAFTFTTQSPTRAVVLLRFQAKDISKDEVAITLNGAEVGFVAADTVDVANRELEVVFPLNLVKLREENQVVFDSVRNPPGEDPWRIWNIWVEALPIPELSREEAVAEAQSSVERGKKAYELREVGPGNLFKAWKAFRQAWLVLEALDDRPKEMYDFVRQQLRQIQPEMDRRCAVLMLEIKKEQELPNADYRRVKELLEGVSSYFPSPEHRCHNISRAALAEMSGGGN